MKVGNCLNVGLKIHFRPEISEERELWDETGAFGTEILRGIVWKKDLGPERAGKWKTGKSGNPKNAKLVCLNWGEDIAVFLKTKQKRKCHIRIAIELI